MLRKYAWLLGGIMLAVGCADGGDTDVTGTGGRGGGGATIGSGGAGGANTGGANTGGAATGGSGGEGGQLSGTVDLCVLNNGGPYDQCQQPAELDYGVVSSGTAEMRMFRIDNGTAEDVLFKSITISNPKFASVGVRYEEDPGSPGDYLRVVDDVPVVRKSGKSLWFEVTYTAGGQAGPVPAVSAIIKLNVGENAAPDIEVPIHAEESGCAPGLGACDSDPTNGCETNTNDSNEHCGFCNNPCDPFQGTGQCVGGVCQLTACDTYAANCDMDGTNGCETNLLNDVDHCGSCTNPCTKANTSAYCMAGNCNIMGCLNNYGDCNLSAADGCETNLANTMAHCGGCNKNCDLAHASETCNPSPQTGLGVCTLSACDSGYKNCNVDPSDGCEISIQDDVSNCGACFNVCSFANAQNSCSAGMCQMGQCNTGYANCDNNQLTGCEINLNSDVTHCGNCNTNCNVLYPNTNATCNSGVCAPGVCAPNYWDIDGNVTNGCEYFCVQQAGTDNPDDSFVDSNCDGIDGDINSAIFVATNGNDTFPGTKTQPMLTISAAIGKAVSVGKTQIYVSNGVYVGRVTLSNGIDLYGGYSAANGWARSSSYISTIRSTTLVGGRMTALEGIGISSATTVDRFSIETTSTSSTGASNYAVYCSGCTGLTLKNNNVSAGNAGPGAAGGVGGGGGDGSVGGGGGTGSCDGSGWGPGGTAGTSPCSRTGGAGGRGGTEGSNSGVAGSTGQIGTAGGPGGGGGDPGSTGGNGSNGTSGGTGSAGSGASGGSISGGFWVSSTGGNGGTGGHGNGGGGAGGGGGQGCTFCDNGAGNGGGGGGGAGCGGNGGFGGVGAGGSFGIFLVSSTGITLIANTVQAGNGGTGGSGGSGGGGGTGANGGLGGTYCTGEVGAGGNGGKGGDGGSGGGGGGGAGGPSYGVYRSGTTVNLSGNAINAGLGGNGGSGGFPNGSAGGSGAAIDIF
jgi:hypothetical protein